MHKSFFVLLLAFTSFMVFAQPDIRVKPKASVDELPFKVQSTDMTTVKKFIEPEFSPESQAKFNELNLMDLTGNDVPTLGYGKVTVIEFWTEKSHPENLYWNRMRDAENVYAGREDIQFISINYDYSRPKKIHLLAMQEFVKKNTPPQTLYLDKDDGFRSFFYVPGPVSYLLIDHRGQYIYGGRADDPGTTVLFDRHIENCLGYMSLMQQQELVSQPQKNN